MADSESNSAMTALVVIVAIIAIGLVAYFALMQIGAAGDNDVITPPDTLDIQMEPPNNQAQ